MTVEELKVLITAQTQGLTREVKKVKEQLGGLEKKAKQTSSGIQKAFKAIKLTALITALTKVIRATTELASNLEEVQNVVEVTFGSMTDRVNEFAKTAIKQFGMSEYSAKKAASTFMAMSNGMGVVKDQGAKMAITLAGLSGDLASFWNTSTEQAQTALKGVYTGETEALKNYGIVMTENTLTAYAMAQGIKKSYKEMSQAEKVALRYKYVLDATKDAQGDFARTSDSWANQTRILKEQWNQLLTILGSGIIQALTPAIKALNKLLETAIRVANGISAAFAKVFGGKQLTMKTNTQQVKEDFNNTSESVEETTESVKDLKKQLASFDEIERLEKPDTKDDKDNKNDQADFDPGLLIDTTEEEGSFKDKFKFDLEESIPEFENFLQQIKDKWDEIRNNLPELKPQFSLDSLLGNLGRLKDAFINCFGNIITEAGRFGINLANSINFDVVITNITNGLISLLHIIETVGTTIFKLFDKIAQDLQLGTIIEKLSGLFSSFMNLADSIVSVLCPAFLKFYDTALSPIVEWIGEKLIDAIDTAKDIMDDWANWFTENKTKIVDFAGKIGELVNKVWELIEPVADEIWESFKELIILISDTVQELFSFILDNQDEICDFLSIIADALGVTLANALQGVATLLKMAADTFKFFVETVKNGAQVLKGIIDTIVGLLTGDLDRAINGVKDVVGGLKEQWRDAWDFMKNIVSDAFDGISKSIKRIVDAVKDAMGTISRLINGNKDKEADVTITSDYRRISPRGNPYLRPNGIPRLASGGVLYNPTIAEMGEYPGASNNPEIVTPQNIMRETMAEANSSVVNAVMAMGSMVTKAIEDKDTDVYMDTTKVTRKITREQQVQNKQRGTPLVRT